jgi:hypothetical protein
MNDFKTVELVFDILEDSEVIQEFEDTLWIKVDKCLYDQYLNSLNDTTE